MPDKYYSHKLYPFQDEILGKIHSLHTDFYLTGGTALGRCYLEHRYSDDLAFRDHRRSKGKGPMGRSH